MGYLQLSPPNPSLAGFGCGCGGGLREAQSQRFGEVPPVAADPWFDKYLVSYLLPTACFSQVGRQLQQNFATLERCLTDIMFLRRHPDRRGKRLTQSAQDAPLAAEWEKIRKDIVRPELALNISDLVSNMDSERKKRCTWFSSASITKLSDAIRTLANPVKRKADGTPMDQIDIKILRDWVPGEVTTIRFKAEMHAEAGCPPVDWKTIIQTVERLPWPNDQVMQAQRTRLLATLVRAQARAAIK